MNDYILTIAIPTYNRKDKLEKLLNSISIFSLENIELLVSDNCSNDGTKEFCEDLKSKLEFTYFRQNCNVGPDLNFLWLLRHSHGKYIWIVSDDDQISNNFIKKTLEFLKTHEVSLGFFNYSLINTKSKELISILKSDKEFEIISDKNEFLSKISFQNTFLCTILFRKESVDKISNPERFNKTNFLQTYIAYESTLFSNLPFFIIYDIELVAYSNDFVNYSIYKVFGESLRNLSKYLYKELDFNRKIVNTQYKKYIKQIVYPGIIHAKHYEYKSMLTKPFKMIKSTLFSMPFFIETCFIVFTPNFIVKFLLKKRKKEIK